MTRRRIVLTTICAVICCAFMTVTSFAADEVVSVNSGADFMKVWKQIEKDYADNFSDVQNTTIKLEGDVEIGDELSMALSGSNVLKVNVDLNGHVLTGTSRSRDYFFNIGNKMDLTIKDTSSSEAGQIVVLCEDKDAGDYDAIVKISNGGHVTLESGSIRGNKNEYCGCVMVNENSLFTMNGGAIRDNSFRSFGYIVPDEHGSAVEVEDGKFVMNGGVIRDNIHWGSGAAVVIDTNNKNDDPEDFGFEMNGGLITENETYADGAGGVYVDDGRASFTGGTIKGNFGASGNLETSASDVASSEIYIDTGAESCYFGGNFVCEYNSAAHTSKAITVRTSGFNSADAPEFGGSVQIESITVEDGWYYDPGIVCKDIDTSAKNHAWIGLTEATDNIKIYTDVDESSDHYATDTNLTKCFFTCAEEISGRDKNMNWERNESMCAVYKDNSFKYIGVVEADDHSEAPICTTSFNRENFKDMSGVTVPESDYSYNWDVRHRAHFAATEAAVDKDKVLDWVDMKYGCGYDQQIGKLEEIKKETAPSGKEYDTKYSFEVKNVVKDGSKEYRRTAYNTFEITTASNLVESKVTMNSREDYTLNYYRTGQTVKIKADYPKNSDCFKKWSITDYESRYEKAINDAISEEMRTEEALSFEMPFVSHFKIVAEYYPTYAVQGEGFAAYRVEESEEIPVTDPQMAGKTIRLEAKGLEDPGWPRWIIYKVETEESGKVVKTDVTSELLGEGIIPSSPEFTMPKYDIEVVCSEAGHTVVNSPYASVKVNSEETKPAGKIAVPYEKNTVLEVTLDETKIPEGHNFIGWDMSFIFTNGAEEDAFAFTPSDGVKSFGINFSDICDYYIAEDLSDIREIRLTARYDRTIDFDANGGTGEMEADTHNPDHKYRLPECKFTAPEGMRFAGWAYEPDGTPMKAGHAISVEKDITLYAIWEEIPATVRVNLYANDGTDNVKTIKAASGEYMLPASAFEAPEGKAFAGWALESDGEVIVDKDITLVYDTDLYTIWKEAEHVHDFETTTVEPTCTAGGYDIHICSCGETKMDNFTDPKGHDWSEFKTLAPSGCVNKGVKARECQVCGLSETEFIEENDHEFEDDFTVDQKATAETDGSMSRHCRNCDATIDSAVIPAMGEAVLAKAEYTYSGTANEPEVMISDREGTPLVEGTDFAVTYHNNINAGTATVLVAGCNKYDANVIIDFKIDKRAQDLKLVSSSRTARYSIVKNKAQYLTALKMTGAKGKKLFRKVSGSSRLSITKSGKIIVKKGTKKGTYRIKVKAVSSCTPNYKYATRTRTITVKVK